MAMMEEERRRSGDGAVGVLYLRLFLLCSYLMIPLCSWNVSAHLLPDRALFIYRGASNDEGSYQVNPTLRILPHLEDLVFQ